MKTDRKEIISMVSDIYDENIEALKIIRRATDNQINAWKRSKKSKIKWLNGLLDEKGGKQVYEVGK